MHDSHPHLESTQAPNPRHREVMDKRQIPCLFPPILKGGTWAPHAHRHTQHSCVSHPHTLQPSCLTHTVHSAVTPTPPEQTGSTAVGPCSQTRSPSSSGPWPGQTIGTHPAKPLNAAGALVLQEQLVGAASGPVHPPQHHVEQGPLCHHVCKASHQWCSQSWAVLHSQAHLPAAFTWPAHL